MNKYIMSRGNVYFVECLSAALVQLSCSRCICIYHKSGSYISQSAVRFFWLTWRIYRPYNIVPSDIKGCICYRSLVKWHIHDFNKMRWQFFFNPEPLTCIGKSGPFHSLCVWNLRMKMRVNRPTWVLARLTLWVQCTTVIAFNPIY